MNRTKRGNRGWRAEITHDHAHQHNSGIWGHTTLRQLITDKVIRTSVHMVYCKHWTYHIYTRQTPARSGSAECSGGLKAWHESPSYACRTWEREERPCTVGGTCTSQPDKDGRQGASYMNIHSSKLASISQHNVTTSCHWAPTTTIHGEQITSKSQAPTEYYFRLPRFNSVYC